MTHDHRWLRGIHFALALSLPFVLVFLLSCKRAKEEKADLGPQSTADDVINGLLDATEGGRTLAGLHGNKAADGVTPLTPSYVNYSIVRRIENSEVVTLLGTQFISVAQETHPEPGKTRLILTVTTNIRNEAGKFDQVTTEDPPLLRDDSSGTDAALTAKRKEQAQAALESFKTYAVRAQEDDVKVVKTTFHKLRVYTGTIDAPDPVKNRPGCAGLNPCEIPVTYVRFDIVNWLDNGDRIKVSLDLAYAKKTVWMPLEGSVFDNLQGLIVADCRSLYYPVNGVNVYVRDCTNLDDFNR